MSRNLLREAEFLFRVAAEDSAEKLRAMLKHNPNRDLPILHRLNELYEGQNLNVLLRLAFRYWTEGLDDEATSVLKQAQGIDPESIEYCESRFSSPPHSVQLMRPKQQLNAYSICIRKISGPPPLRTDWNPRVR